MARSISIQGGGVSVYNPVVAGDIMAILDHEVKLIHAPDGRDKSMGEGYRTGRISGLLSALAVVDQTAALDYIDQFERRGFRVIPASVSRTGPDAK